MKIRSIMSGVERGIAGVFGIKPSDNLVIVRQNVSPEIAHLAQQGKLTRLDFRTVETLLGDDSGPTEVQNCLLALAAINNRGH